MSSAQLLSTADDAALPSGPCILNLSRLQQDEAVRTAPHLRLGVALPVDQPAEVLAPYLDRLSLVAVNFPTFRDGRGFTQARSLRERLAFSAEIRATGGGPLLLRLSALRTQRAGPVRPSPNDTTWRAAEYLIAVDRKIGSDPATTQNNVSSPKILFNSANRPSA
jgi:hypothetical protein